MNKDAKIKISATAFVVTFIGAVLFSTKAVIVKKAFADIKVDALSLLAVRMICAVPFYLIIAGILRCWTARRLRKTLRHTSFFVMAAVQFLRQQPAIQIS